MTEPSERRSSADTLSTERPPVEFVDFVDFVESALRAKRAEDIVRLDLREVTDITDTFLIATITNQRQGAAIVQECERERKRRGAGRVGIEGANGSSWIVLDYGDFVVHLFLPEQRAYYALEHLWADARRVNGV